MKSVAFMAFLLLSEVEVMFSVPYHVLGILRYTK